MGKPRVLIVTLCRSLNAGAFLQAYALQEALKARHLEPHFLDIYGYRQSFKRFRALFKKKDRNVAGLLFNARKLVAFARAELHLSFTRKRDGRFVAAFLGSDEIWSVVNTTFVPSREFFGLDLPNQKKFAYAPSAGNTTMANANHNIELYSGLKLLAQISVRDDTTKAIAKSIVPGVEISSVVDPAFLHDFSKEAVPFEIDEKYLAVYSYGMTVARIEEIKQYARRHNLKLVSPGFNNAWCDIVLPCSPFQFISVIKNAESVITDTFHGTVFSIKYEKHFVAYSKGKSKVHGLLSDFNLQSSHIDDGDLSKVNRIVTDYSSVRDVIKNKIFQSERYLDACLRLIRN